MAHESLLLDCPECGATRSKNGLCARCLMAAAAEPTEPGARRAVSLDLDKVTAAFPQLEVMGMIGQGGMGSVFKVRQPKLDRFAALKLLPESLASDFAFAGRFEREARLLAKLSHPNIVGVYDYGLAGNFFYLLMEFVDGVNLRQAMNASRFAPRQALGIVPKICDALQYAHDEGVLHRDIKPENILLDTKGRVKLVDFGIAKLAAESESIYPTVNTDPAFTQAGVTLGTPSYMAPEQRDNPSAVDHRADIYSLGVVFYELLTGELPTATLPRPSEKSGADPRVDVIVQQSLEKQRDRRQNSAGQLRTQVETIAQIAGPASSDIVPKFSRGAILGAIWATLFFPFVIVMFSGQIQPLPYTGPTPLERFLRFTLLPLGIAAPFGVTVLGLVAVMRIRRSHGRLVGMKLAVFDGLLFPLLALDAAIAILLEYAALHTVWSFQLFPASVLKILGGLMAIVLPLMVDGWIITAVWRAVKPQRSDSHSKPKSTFRLVTVLGAMCSLIVIAVIFRQFIPLSEGTGSNSTTFHCLVFEADAAAVDKLIPISQRQSGLNPNDDSAYRTSEGKSREFHGDFTVQRTVQLTDSEVASITPATLDALQKSIDPGMGLLLDRTGSFLQTGGIRESPSLGAIPKQHPNSS